MLAVFFIIANGDLDFQSMTIRPIFQYRHSSILKFITFHLNYDNIIEGQEIGEMSIDQSIAFDGFTPRYQTVRIIINDSNGTTFLVLYHLFSHASFIYDCIYT